MSTAVPAPWRDFPPSRRVPGCMSPGIRPGARVPVRHDRRHPRAHHEGKDLALFQHVGVVDRIDERFGDHRYIVVFPTLAVPPFGAAWCDAFTASEPVSVA